MFVYIHKSLNVSNNFFLLAVILIAFSCSSKKFTHLKKIKANTPNYVSVFVKYPAISSQIINNPIIEKKCIDTREIILVKQKFKNRVKQQFPANNFSKRILPPGLNRQNNDEFKNGALLSLAFGVAAMALPILVPSLSLLLLLGVLILSLAAIIAGVIAYKSGSPGKGFAVIGIVLGAICLLSLFLLLALMFVLL